MDETNDAAKALVTELIKAGASSANDPGGNPGAGIPEPNDNATASTDDGGSGGGGGGGGGGEIVIIVVVVIVLFIIVILFAWSFHRRTSAPAGNAASYTGVREARPPVRVALDASFAGLRSGADTVYHRCIGAKFRWKVLS